MTFVPLTDDLQDKPSTKFLSPLAGTITSGHEDMRDQGARVHRAIDIGAPAGTEFYAPANIKVTHVRKKMSNSPGGMVWGTDDSGQLHKFIHVIPGVNVGDTVQAGQPMGTLHDMKGPHLHWGVKNLQNDEYINLEQAHGYQKGSKLTLDWRNNMLAGPGATAGSNFVPLEKALAMEQTTGGKEFVPLGQEPTAKRPTDSSTYVQQELLRRIIGDATGLEQYGVQPAQLWSLDEQLKAKPDRVEELAVTP